jgi:hypothetical protein
MSRESQTLSIRAFLTIWGVGAIVTLVILALLAWRLG